MARIALVNDVAGVAANQARILRAAGHDVDEIRLSMVGGRWNWPAKVLVIPLRVIAYLPVIVKLRFGRYDVVHIHWVLHGLLGLCIGRPFFVQAHGTDLHVNLGRPILGRLTHLVLRHAALIFYVTPNLRAFLAEYKAKARLLPNPVDIDAIPLAPAPESVSNVLIFTRLDPVKGVDEIFKSVRRLSEMVKVSALDWGPLAREYTTRYRDCVWFTHALPRPQIETYLQKFDLVIGQMKQGIMSLSEIEAVAAGRPLITRLERSLYEDDLPPAVIVADADDIVAAVARLRHDGPELARLSLAGREWARRNHSFERHRALLEASYFGERVPERASATPIAR